MNWYVLTTKSGEEHLVRELLEQRGIWVYMPTGVKTTWHRRKKVTLTEFYTPFTGYLFAMLGRGQWKDLAECGARVVKCDKIPVVIPYEAVTAMLGAEEEGLFDVNRGSVNKRHSFELGDNVRVSLFGRTIVGFIEKLKGGDKLIVKAERYGKKVKAEVRHDQAVLA